MDKGMEETVLKAAGALQLRLFNLRNLDIGTYDLLAVPDQPELQVQPTLQPTNVDCTASQTSSDTLQPGPSVVITAEDVTEDGLCAWPQQSSARNEAESVGKAEAANDSCERQSEATATSNSWSWGDAVAAAEGGVEAEGEAETEAEAFWDSGQAMNPGKWPRLNRVTRLSMDSPCGLDPRPLPPGGRLTLRLHASRLAVQPQTFGVQVPKGDKRVPIAEQLSKMRHVFHLLPKPKAPRNWGEARPDAETVGYDAALKLVQESWNPGAFPNLLVEQSGALQWLGHLEDSGLAAVQSLADPWKDTVLTPVWSPPSASAPPPPPAEPGADHTNTRGAGALPLLGKADAVASAGDASEAPVDWAVSEGSRTPSEAGSVVPENEADAAVAVDAEVVLDDGSLGPTEGTMSLVEEHPSALLEACRTAAEAVRQSSAHRLLRWQAPAEPFTIAPLYQFQVVLLCPRLFAHPRSPPPSSRVPPPSRRPSLPQSLPSSV